ncbi:MAG: 7-cyano-7-deazaguanine synthase QueC [Candidatus Omnitrophica bacterium CG_4_9_14_0_2_um_filter_42_8]|nr:MAG: 7-cyano-7-deazaguanine synthase QueC [Candidatus Omnitrophica bacterium CG22_combo_CG10-13_8_21_14_all_43_16]PJC47066.1 MAG: 7-cyano-7-deazaguanine synthase QueC [Candidatus Omnitrophica bacterium CG_4_9_14_0_2_um_filter_42_8]
MKKAVVLLSGGMDSAVTLFIAKKKGFKPYCLAFDYGQRHKKEILFAKKMAKAAKAEFTLLKIRLPWKNSALLDKNIKVPENRKFSSGIDIPATYVPARNTVFLSFALSYAEAIGAKAVFIGANAIDFSGYPDCRPQYYRVFNELFKKAIKLKDIKIITPLLYKTKEDIVKLGRCLGVDFNLTWSCYKGGSRPCGVCDACRLRAKGFK